MIRAMSEVPETTTGTTPKTTATIPLAALLAPVANNPRYPLAPRHLRGAEGAGAGGLR